jgi:hypothetical protein
MNSDSLNRKSRLQQRQSETVSHAFGGDTQVIEFETPEEMIEYDAKQTELPSELTESIQHAIDEEPAPRSGWRRKLFG